MPLDNKYNYQDVTLQGANVPLKGLMIFSGTVTGVSASSGSYTEINIGLSKTGFLLKRVQCFQSANVPSSHFDLEIHRTHPATTSSFEPRDVLYVQRDITGSTDFRKGIDSIEEIPCIPGSDGKIYLLLNADVGSSIQFSYALHIEPFIWFNI